MTQNGNVQMKERLILVLMYSHSVYNLSPSSFSVSLYLEHFISTTFLQVSSKRSMFKFKSRSSGLWHHVMLRYDTDVSEDLTVPNSRRLRLEFSSPWKFSNLVSV